MTISLKVKELYESKAYLLGHRIVGKDSSGKEVEHIAFNGFVNEKSLSEGVKRAAYKIGRQLEIELTAINDQRLQIASYVEPGLGEQALTELRLAKDSGLLEDDIEFTFEPISFSKIEHLSLTDNYQFLYDKFFN